MTISFMLMLALALAWLLVGAAIMTKAMSYIKSNALADHDFFVMSIQDSRNSPSMILPKLTLILAGPMTLLFVALVLFLASLRTTAQPA